MAGRFLFRTLTDVFFLSVPVLAGTGSVTPCRYIPGDDGWPSQADWALLNNTVGGQLIATIPQASVCHTSPYSDYNETECEALAAGWDLAKTFESHPAEIMNAYYQNQSCDPFTPASRLCELGNFAAYSIRVASAQDVVAGIRFGREKNIRLVVKTTGHDYTGRSTGLGALSLWTWNLKTAEVNPRYENAWYSGPAIKLGSGVIAGDAYAAAHKAGYRLVGGECGSIGVAAGYTQGGGHSMLSTAYGMAADQVLEWEVVTALGEHLIATPEQNADLYWALSGGGGGTYGVVLSMTAKIYPDGPIAGGSLAFENTGEETYWEAIALWFQRAPALVGENNTIIFLVMNHAFEALAITLPDQPVSAVETLLAPYLADLDRLNITYSRTTTHSDNYYDHFNTYFGPLPYGNESPTTILINRIVPLAIAQSASATATLVDALRSTVAVGTFLVGCSIMNVANASHPDNAVLPAWRDAITACNVNAYWNYTAPLAANLAVKKELVEVHMPAIEAATPGAGVYLNEMDPWYRGDWKVSLYGANYDRLLGIKHKYDPFHVFWGNFSVGSDELVIDGSGRLCRV